MALEKPGTLGSEAYAEEAPVAEAEATAQIPSTMLGGQAASPGDVVRLEVVSVDDESGLLTVKYAKAAAPEKKLGVDAMAAEFD